MEYYGVPRESELGFRGVYRLESDGDNRLTLLADDFDQPNGLAFSTDEALLFVNDTMRGHVRVFDVRPDGSIINGRVWCEVTGDGNGAPDGMKVDAQDNLYCTGPGGVHVFDPDANCLGVIHVPEVVANFTWGGDDMCDLFMTASTSLYRCRVRIPGRAPF
jgi:gluconolactonase